jgi:8-hydroxy-5-deazaflavin:NADPH oxidoreductase
MRKQGCFDCSRRALLGASGGSALLAALRPLRIFAQASGGKLRIGIIGSGHIGGAIGGLWVRARHPVLFSPSPAVVAVALRRRAAYNGSTGARTWPSRI